MQKIDVIIMGNFGFIVIAVFLTGTAQTFGSDIRGRLLTPKEGCGYSNATNTRIVGGSPAKVGAWPWMALLGYERNGKTEFLCGGSLITSRHVLSAAHCMYPGLHVVRLGEHDLSTLSDGPHQDVPICYIDEHEKYIDHLSVNDIAMVTLAEDVEFNDRIRPICLPFNRALRTRSFSGTNPFLAGWGRMEEAGKRSDVLMQVQVPVIENQVCKECYRRIGLLYLNRQFDDRIMCAGHMDGGKDSCQGDSGGPLMLPIHENGAFPFYQIGIVSWAKGCGRPNLPGINTNIQSFATWIQEKLLEYLSAGGSRDCNINDTFTR